MKNQEGLDAAEKVNEFTQFHSPNTVVILAVPCSFYPSPPSSLVPLSLSP